MSVEVVIRLLVAVAFSGALLFGIYRRNQLEQYPEGKQPRYAAYLPAFLLPMFLAMLVPVSLLIVGPQETMHAMFSLCFTVFLHTSTYFLLLLLALPLLRRWISARVCAVLWLLPTYLYYTELSLMDLPEPQWVIFAPWKLAGPVIAVWAVGFLAVLGWKMGSHFAFRKKILHCARTERNQAVLDLWRREQERANFKKTDLQLMRSSAVQTPLSIGFFRSTTRVVLPERDYTMEELALIFRHEIIHIGREDSDNKFFLVFCTAMCWFNPLMWIAMRRSAEDLELSCDETVLLEADEPTRRRYAELLLKTAGDERGFTTCLSASAKTMRYRLKNVVKPRRRLVGGVAAGLIFFALMLSGGYVALAYDTISGQELIFEEEKLSDFSVNSIRRLDAEKLKFYDCGDEAALNDYLAGLTFHRMTGNYTFPEKKENGISVLYHGPDGVFAATLTDEVLEITVLHSGGGSGTYYHTEEIDWEYLYSLLTEREEEKLPYPPEMMLYFNEDINPNGTLMHVETQILSMSEGGEPIEVTYRGDGQVGGVSGISVTEVQLYFSHALPAGYWVEVTGWAGEEPYDVYSQDLEDPYRFPLAAYDARYTVHTLCEDGDMQYEMQYRFDVDLP